MAQCLDPYELVLLVCEDPTAGDLASSAAWKAPIVLGSGGWDFDALVEGSRLGVVYREVPHALRRPVQGSLGEEVIETTEVDQEGLQVRSSR